MHRNEVNILALSEAEYTALVQEAEKLGQPYVKTLKIQEKRQKRQAN